MCLLVVWRSCAYGEPDPLLQEIDGQSGANDVCMSAMTSPFADDWIKARLYKTFAHVDIRCEPDFLSVRIECAECLMTIHEMR